MIALRTYCVTGVPAEFPTVRWRVFILAKQATNCLAPSALSLPTNT